MGRQHSLWILCLACLSDGAHADAMRCKNALISDGDSSAELLLKCGEPMLRDEVQQPQLDRWGNLVLVKVAERWVYHFGKNEFIRFVTIKNGRISAIENGPHGD